MNAFTKLVISTLCVSVAIPLEPLWAMDGAPTLPQGTRVYLTLDKEVTSQRGEFDVGSVVQCKVWRDVENEGRLFIKGGAAASCQVDKIKRRQMGGGQGKISIAGLETRSVDGQLVMLSGGYNKDGGSRKVAVWTVGLLLFWPALFIPGRQAVLPPGTIFDVSTVNDLHMKLDPSAPVTPPRLNLSAFSSELTATAMLDELLA